MHAVARGGATKTAVQPERSGRTGMKPACKGWLMKVGRLVPVQGALPLLCRPDNPGTASRSRPKRGEPIQVSSEVGRGVRAKGP